MPRHEVIVSRRIEGGADLSSQTWLARLVDWTRRSFTLPPVSIQDPALRELFGGPPTDAGVSITEATALNISAVWDAVQIIAGAVASLPLHLYKRLPGGGKERMLSSRVSRLLHDDPNPEMTTMVWRETLQAHVLLWGNGYSEIERAQSGEPVWLWPIAPTRVHPDRTRDTRALIYDVSNSGRPNTVLQPENMLHIPGLGFDGVTGYSVIQKARQSLGLTAAAEKFGAQFFGKGARSGGVFKHPKTLSPDARTHLKDSLASLQAHEYAVLEEGMELERWTIPPDDAQFLQSRQFQVTEIARWFNLPPHKLKDLTRSTYSNIESQEIDFVVGTLRPWLVRWEQELNRKLIRPLERTIQFTEHLVDGLLRGDIASRYAAYAVGRQWGWLSADDVREKENMNPLEDGQGRIYLIPSNMFPADKADEIQPPGAAPPARPEAPMEQDGEKEEAAARRIEQIVEGLKAEIVARTGPALRDMPMPQMGEEEGAFLDRCMASAMMQAEFPDADQRLGVCSHQWGNRSLHPALVSVEEGLRALREDRGKEAEERALTSEALIAMADSLRAEIGRVEEAMRQAVAAGQTDTAAAMEAALTSLRGELVESQQALLVAEEARATERTQALQAQEARLAASEAAQAESLAALREEAAQAGERVQERLEALRVDAAKREQSRQDRAGLLAAHRHLLQDAMRRVLHREGVGARKASQSPEKLRAWMEKFYGRRQPMVDALLPAMDLHVLLLAPVQESAASRAEVVIGSHCVRSRDELEALLAESPDDLASRVEALTVRWEQDRPGQVADGLMEEVATNANPE